MPKGKIQCLHGGPIFISIADIWRQRRKAFLADLSKCGLVSVCFMIRTAFSKSITQRDDDTQRVAVNKQLGENGDAIIKPEHTELDEATHHGSQCGV